MNQLNEYLISQTENIKPLNENTGVEGETSVCEAVIDPITKRVIVPPHYHKYVLFNEYGYGHTGGPIATGNMGVVSHEHMIIDGKVVPFGDEHIHTLATKDKVYGNDIDLGAVECCHNDIPPQMGSGT